MNLADIKDPRLRARIEAADHDAHPPAPVIATPAERATAARVEVKAERELQARILAFLTQHRQAGTVRFVINPPMNRRSQLPAGAPDFTFVYRGRPVALEAKMPGKDAEPHQLACHEAMRADGWLVMVVRSVDDVAAALDAMETGR